MILNIRHSFKLIEPYCNGISHHRIQEPDLFRENTVRWAHAYIMYSVVTVDWFLVGRKPSSAVCE
jgi:hypothetical protein